MSALDPLATQLAAFRRAHPPRTRSVDGIPFRYHAAGHSGTAVTILPGLLGEGEMSFQLATALAASHRLIVPSWPRAADTADALARGVAAILSGEGIQETAVVGASFGGLVAQRFALRHPDRVSRLILADTSVPRAARAATNRRAARIFAVLPSGLVCWLLRGLGGKAMKGVDPTGFWTRYTAEVVAGLGAEDLAARYRAAADFDAGPVLDGKALVERTLLLESDDDPIVRREAAAALRRAFPGAALHVFKGGGHAPSILRPDEYAQVIAAFLARP